MRKSALGIIAIFILVMSASGCTGTGSGNVIKEPRNVSGFKEISLSGDMNLFIKQGSTESLVIEAEDNVVSNIKTEVSDDVLTINYGGFFASPIPTKPVNIYITVKDLNAVDISGNGKAEATNINTNNLNIAINGAGNANLNNITADKLEISISGSGNVKASGKVVDQNINISGSGEYLAETLESNSAGVVINGSGEATVYAIEQLDIEIKGSGKVSYMGNPTVKQNISGSGEVNKLSK